MADISMCPGIGCPSKNSCYRFTAPVNEYRQAYAAFYQELVGSSEDKCENYWRNE
jgi:hypothetical protein